MLKKLGMSCLLAGSVIAANTASAGMIVDVVSQNVKLSNDSYSYTHNILDEGFVLGSAISASLAINLYDDRDHSFLGVSVGESALIVVENFLNLTF